MKTDVPLRLRRLCEVDRLDHVRMAEMAKDRQGERALSFRGDRSDVAEDSG